MQVSRKQTCIISNRISIIIAQFIHIIRSTKYYKKITLHNGLNDLCGDNNKFIDKNKDATQRKPMRVFFLNEFYKENNKICCVIQRHKTGNKQQYAVVFKHL